MISLFVCIHDFITVSGSGNIAGLRGSKAVITTPDTAWSSWISFCQSTISFFSKLTVQPVCIIPMPWYIGIEWHENRRPVKSISPKSMKWWVNEHFTKGFCDTYKAWGQSEKVESESKRLALGMRSIRTNAIWQLHSQVQTFQGRGVQMARCPVYRSHWR